MTRFAIALCAMFLPLAASAVPPTTAELLALCTNAESRTHCGRLIEEAQMKKLPGLATRNGDELKVTLYPSGTTIFRDTMGADGEKSFALFDYLDRINAVVLYTTNGDRSGFLLLQRANGHQYPLPANPVLAPDRQHLATADFCAEQCSNEVVVWRITRDDVKRELVWQPKVPWPDASVEWKSDVTLVIDCTPPGEDKPCRVERSLNAPDWTRTGS
jgi:hypothetical protein